MKEETHNTPLDDCCDTQQLIIFPPFFIYSMLSSRKIIFIPREGTGEIYSTYTSQRQHNPPSCIHHYSVSVIVIKKRVVTLLPRAVFKHQCFFTNKKYLRAKGNQPLQNKHILKKRKEEITQKQNRATIRYYYQPPW